MFLLRRLPNSRQVAKWKASGERTMHIQSILKNDSLKQLAQSTMRAAIGEMKLDGILDSWTTLNNIIKTNVQETAEMWGVEVKRYEMSTFGY